jgi:peptidoglycan/LPS O-acetylase OafA/YrhL
VDRVVDQTTPATPATPAAHPHLQAASKHQLFYFDAVRGLSAQMVVVGHSLNLFLPAAFMVQRANGTYRTTSGIFYMQSYGVLLFFVLSGFLVSRSALAKMSSPGYTFGEFFLERLARVFVPFVPAVLLVAVTDRLVLHGRSNPFTTIPLDIWTTVTNLTMLYNNPVMRKVADLTGLPLRTGPIGTADPFWSVVIEFWIYIAFGLILLRLFRDRRIGVVGLLALVFSLAVVAQTIDKSHGLVLSWVVGMAYAIGRPRAWFTARWLHKVLGMVALVAIPLCLRHTHWNVYDEYVALATSVAVMSLFAGFGRPAPGPAVRTVTRATSAEPATAESGVASPPTRRPHIPAPVRTIVKYVSDYSYSLYLVHFSLLIYLQTVPAVRSRPAVAIVLGFLVANAVAFGFWFLIERHYPSVRRALRRTRFWQVLFPARPTAASSA